MRTLNISQCAGTYGMHVLKPHSERLSCENHFGQRARQSNENLQYTQLDDGGAPAA